MSTLRLTTIANQGNTASVPSETVINGSAKAWVNFNGTSTVAIRASFNVTSITDIGTGNYAVNFTTAMPDANYAVCYTVSNNSGQSAPRTGSVNFGINGGSPTTSLVYIASGVSGSTTEDLPYNNVAIFR